MRGNMHKHEECLLLHLGHFRVVSTPTDMFQEETEKSGGNPHNAVLPTVQLCPIN